MSEESKESQDSGASAGEIAQQMKQKFLAFGLQDRIVLAGGAFLVLLYFLPWWSVSFRGGSNLISGGSVSGFNGIHWLGFFLCLASLLITLPVLLAKMLNAEFLKTLSGLPWLQVALAAATFFFGPLLWLLRAPSGASGGGVDAGLTFWFWLAFLAGLAMVAGAGWKLYLGLQSKAA